MTPRRTRLPAPLALALLLSFASTIPAAAGPPWISIEYPANPHDRATRGALLLVHAYHHGDAMRAPVTGTAEGLVNGRRQSLPLEVVATSRPGVYAVRQQIPASGSWLLVLTVRQSGESGATALVAMRDGGEIASVRVPATRRDGWTVPSEVSAQEIEAALRAHASVASITAEAGTGNGATPLAAAAVVGVLPLSLLALLGVVRRRMAGREQ